MIKKSLTLLSVFALLISMTGTATALSEACVSDTSCGDEKPRQEEEEPSGSGSDQLLEYIRVTSPNGGEILGRQSGLVMTTLLPLDKHQITWESLSTRVMKVDILYSLDFGTNYVSIADGVDNTGYFNWTLPNADSDQALIRINAHGPAGENLGSDRSNSPFIIRNYIPTSQDVSTSTSEYDALYISNSAVGTVAPGQVFTVNVVFKNVGTATWYQYSDFPVHLGTQFPQDRISVFEHSSWMSSNRASGLMEGSVVPGEVGTFMFTMQAPASSGDYHEVFAPVVEGLTWMNSASTTFDIIVS